MLVTALAACAGTAPVAAPPGALTLRVMTYNIFAGNDLERRSNLARVAALIDSLAVDIALLQEVDRRTARSGGVDQAATIAEHAGRHAVFGSSMAFDGGEYGNAIVSRWPATWWRVVPLDAAMPAAPGASPAEPRSLLHAVFATPAGDVHVLNTHLDHRPESPWRRAQIVELLAYVADSVPRYARVVFGGDLNATPDSPDARAFGAAFDDAWPACGTGPGDTFRADRPDRRIDYIKLARVTCTAAWVHATEASDHRPLIVDVRIAPAGTRR
jgi:endonuclease/exonuclease/phosphatase family metal-dependent hydrolase